MSTKVQLYHGCHVVVTGFDADGTKLPNIQLDVYGGVNGAHRGSIVVPDGKSPKEALLDALHGLAHGLGGGLGIISNAPNSFDIEASEYEGW